MTKKKSPSKKTAPRRPAIQRSIATTIMSPLRKAAGETTIKAKAPARVKTVVSHTNEALKRTFAHAAAPVGRVDKRRVTNIDKNRRVGERTMRALHLNSNVSRRRQRRFSLWLTIVMALAILGGAGFYANERGLFGRHAAMPRWESLHKISDAAQPSAQKPRSLTDKRGKPATTSMTKASQSKDRRAAKLRTADNR